MSLCPIVLGTNPDRTRYVENFMRSVPKLFRDYIYVAETWDQELGAIREGANKFDRFAFLQDTAWISANSWMVFMDAINKYHTAYILPRPSCYMMVYDSSIVSKALPHVGMPGQDKELAILGETMFVDRYEELAGGSLSVIYPEMTDGEALAAGRYFYLDNESGKPRLHLRSADGVLSKFKATFR